MPLTMRYLPKPGRPVLSTSGGRSYPVTGATVDLPAFEIVGDDQATQLMTICPTVDRPTNVPGAPNCLPDLMIPPRLFDSTLGAMIFAVPDSFPLRWVTLDGAPA